MNAVEFCSVSEKYTLRRGHASSLKSVLLSFGGGVEGRGRDFWALKDLSLSIPEGSVVGIIGENGAGKSTLLKLATGIIEPDEGQVVVNGRVSALLELGAGFHTELTGRENIYLNGAILGLKRRQIHDCFDRIVGFAELEEFIDMPVKSYSSGMYVRLGFAIAVHVNPDVLIIDEALAVGDEAFQQKSLNKIIEFKNEGKSIIFVSHNLGAIERLCDRCVWLHKGEIRAMGPVRDVLREYDIYVAEGFVATLKGKDGYKAKDEIHGRRGDLTIRIEKVTLFDEKGRPTNSFKIGEAMSVRVDYMADVACEAPVFGVAIWREDNIYVYGTNTIWDEYPTRPIAPGRGSFEIGYSSLPLLEGYYKVSAAIFKPGGTTPYDAFDFHPPHYPFRIQGEGKSHGIAFLGHSWRQQ
ncbi:ABC transporter ATP-binding protein [bacterium]|nr:ABC transporter ATP-binding protein [bacterium]